MGMEADTLADRAFPTVAHFTQETVISLTKKKKLMILLTEAKN